MGVDDVFTRSEQLVHYILERSSRSVEGRKTFIGVESHPKTPLDILPSVLLGKASKHTLLVVDKFQEIGGQDKAYISKGIKNLYSRVDELQGELGVNVEFVLCSSFMNSSKYTTLSKSVRELVNSQNLANILRLTIPKGKGDDISFAVEEVAVSIFMEQEFGMEIKVGQPRERLYDGAIGKLCTLDFAYLHPSIAFVTGNEVTPYNPSSGTSEGGKRINLGQEVARAAYTYNSGPRSAQAAHDRIYDALAVVR